MTQVALNATEKNLLKRIADDTNNPQQPFGFASKDDVSTMVNNGLVELNDTYPNPSDASQFAVRITDSGRDYLNSLSDTKAAQSQAASPFAAAASMSAPAAKASAKTASGQTAATSSLTPVFTRRKDIPVPAKAPRKLPEGFGKASKYPFEDMEVNESFHVPMSALSDSKDPFKAMQSSVAGANRRYTTVNQPPTPKINKKGNVVTHRKTGQPVMQTTASRHYTCVAVDQNDVDGPGIRVFRVS